MLSTTHGSKPVFLTFILVTLIVILYYSYSNNNNNNAEEKVQLCESNPFLRHFNRQIIEEYEKKWLDWKRKHFTKTFQFLKNYAQTSGKVLGDFPMIVNPSMPILPCSDLKRYGNSRDTGKQLCELKSLSVDDRCIVYSLGSNNDFQFEQAILSQTHCLVHTFDCTSSPPKNSQPQLTFHNICLGENSPLQEHIYPQSGKSLTKLNNTKFMKFDEILQMTKHTRIHVLKMDIEGGEYSVFADLLENSNRLELPFQISFESHWWNKDIYHSILHMALFEQLFQSGYRLLQYELNEGDRSCVEWTFLRVFCQTN